MKTILVLLLLAIGVTAFVALVHFNWHEIENGWTYQAIVGTVAAVGILLGGGIIIGWLLAIGGCHERRTPRRARLCPCRSCSAQPRRRRRRAFHPERQRTTHQQLAAGFLAWQFPNPEFSFRVFDEPITQPVQAELVLTPKGREARRTLTIRFD